MTNVTQALLTHIRHHQKSCLTYACKLQIHSRRASLNTSTGRRTAVSAWPRISHQRRSKKTLNNTSLCCTTAATTSATSASRDTQRFTARTTKKTWSSSVSESDCSWCAVELTNPSAQTTTPRSPQALHQECCPSMAVVFAVSCSFRC